MFCPNCGARIPDESRFCTSCGAPIQAMPVMNETPVPNDTPIQPEQPVQQPFAQAPISPQFQQEQPVQQPFAQAPVSPQFQQEQPVPKKKSKAPLIIIIAVVLVILLGVGGFFGYKFYKDAKEKKAFKAEIRTLMDQGDSDVHNGYFSDAIDSYLTVLDKDPDNTEASNALTQAYISYAGSYADADDYHRAIRILQDADGRADQAALTAEIASLEQRQADYEAEQIRIAEEMRLEAERLEQERLEQERLQAIADAPNTLSAYLFDTLIPEYGNVDDYTDYAWYIGSADSDVYAEFLTVNGVLAYHLSDMDADDVCEMIVFISVPEQVDLEDSTIDTQDIYAVVYEVDGYDVYEADSILIDKQWFGASDYEFDRIFSIQSNGMQYYGIDVEYEQSLLTDSEFMSITLLSYDGSSIVTLIHEFVNGSDEIDNDVFDFVAEDLYSIGLIEAANGIDDGTYSQLNFTAGEYTDSGLELLFVAYGRNSYLDDMDTFRSDVYKEFQKTGDLSLLGTVDYEIITYSY